MKLFKVTKKDMRCTVRFLGIKFTYTLKNIDMGNNNKIILVKEGKECVIKSVDNAKIKFFGNNNTVKIGENCNFEELRITFRGNNNEIIFGDDCTGEWNITCYLDNNRAEIGDNVQCCSVNISLVNGELKIGKGCMLSNNINIWSDGHAVLDYETKEVINLSTKPIIIGEHVWIGERVTICKNSQIPNDSIVGISSVVTKAFDEEHTLIAGNPAMVKKRGITWDGREPLTYYNDTHPQN